jgi:3,4-dihydroxy-2-butanone 4-phosphate synthase
MVVENADPKGTAYTVSIDSSDPSITTGISAHDRALTCRTLAPPTLALGASDVQATSSLSEHDQAASGNERVTLKLRSNSAD